MFYAQFHHFFGQAGQLKTNFVLKSQGQQLIRGFWKFFHNSFRYRKSTWPRRVHRIL